MTSITDLHESIILHIFFFLSAKSILRCKSVCKTWATLISQLSYSSKLYTRRPPLHLLPIQFLLNGTHCFNHQHLLLTEFDHKSSSDNDSRVPITKSLLPNIFVSPYSLKICSTCNFTGFVAAYVKSHDPEVSYQLFDPLTVVHEVKHLYHLFNSLTAHHIVVPNSTNRWGYCALVFAQKTNQLKLIQVPYESLYVDIQTIGTRMWMTIEIRQAYYPPFLSEFSVFLNGAYHWLCTSSAVICVFNADDEVFDEILTPLSIEDSTYKNIGVLDDCLCICMKGLECEFWVMNEYGVPESWTKKFVIFTSYNIPQLYQYQTFEPLRCLGNGEILILRDDDEVISYNLHTKSCKIIKKYFGNDLWYKAIPYVPCFSKLCGLNGEIL